MSTPHAHLPCHADRTYQVRKQPGAMPALRYPASVRHADPSIWSMDHRGNWHLSTAPVHATLSRGDRPPSRSREQVCFT